MYKKPDLNLPESEYAFALAQVLLGIHGTEHKTAE